MKKFKITKGNRVYIVDAKSHIDAINKVKSIKDAKFLTEDKEADKVKDSSIRDYSPEVYIKELEKLIPEYQRLGDLKGKIRESLVTSGKTDKSKMGPDFKLILNDAKVQQWVKQVRELDKKWNNILTNLNRFGANVYKQQSNGSDLDVWLNSLPDSWTISDIKFAVKSEYRKYRDSISQWKPGMSEIGLFQISYKKGTVNQSILVKAATKEDAINKFTKHKPDAEVIGVNEYPNPHFGEPILDSKIKDIDEYKKNYAAAMRAAGEKAKKDQINSDIQKLYDIAKQYGPVRTEQNKLNNEFEQQNMQVVRNRFYNDPTVKRALKQMEDLDTKWNAIVDKYKVLRQYSIPQDGPNRFMSWNTPTKKWVDDIKKQLIKDSAIKDEDYSKYLSIVKQLEKLVEPANRALQQKIEKYGVTKQDIRNNSPKYRDVCREIPELKVWAKLIMQLPGVLQGTMSAYPSQESVDKLKKVVTNGKAFDSTIKDSYGWSYIMAPMKTPGDKDLNILRNLRSTYYDDMYQDVYNIRKAFAKATNKRVAINMAKDMPEYAKFIRTLDSVDKDWNAIISKYPSLKKFKINTTGAERLLYGYYPTLKDFVDEITPVIKKEW